MCRWHTVQPVDAASGDAMGADTSVAAAVNHRVGVGDARGVCAGRSSLLAAAVGKATGRYPRTERHREGTSAVPRSSR